MQDLKGKVAVITGGAGGIGLAMARRFVSEGMKVCIADIDEDRLSSARSALAASGADVLAVPTDVSVESSVANLRDAVTAAFGPYDLVCNNAGVVSLGASWETDRETWEWVLGVNLWGVIHGVRVLVPPLVEQDAGHVVNTASMAGLLASPFVAPYTATKHAVVGLTESLRGELAMRGSSVGVSVLCPGFVHTEIFARGRPGRAGGEPAEAGDAASTIGEMFVAGVQNGARADEIADLVASAVLDERFWILNDSNLAEAALDRLTQAVRGEPRRRWP